MILAVLKRREEEGCSLLACNLLKKNSIRVHFEKSEKENFHTEIFDIHHTFKVSRNLVVPFSWLQAWLMNYL